MNAAVLVTIWTAMALFVAGEAGKRRARLAGGLPPRWAWPAWAAGAVLCGAHVVLAMGVVHLWSHDAAVRSTAAQTEAMFGFAAGRGIYVSYAFAAIWIADAIWWRASPAAYVDRPRWITALLRAFSLLVILNAAIVFAAPSRRLAGLAVVLALAWLWLPIVNSPKRAPASAPSAPARRARSSAR